MSEKHSPLPWKIGDEHGYNADKITDANSISVCAVYGISLNTTVELARTKWNCEGLFNAAYIVRAANAFPKLVEALEKAIEVASDVDCITDAALDEFVLMCESALALAKGVSK